MLVGCHSVSRNKDFLTLKEMRHWYDVLRGVFCSSFNTNSVLLVVVFVISQKKFNRKTFKFGQGNRIKQTFTF